jgi:hypothetical protein
VDVVTYPEARELCSAVKYPKGWHVEPRLVRRFKWRDKLNLIAFHDSMPVFGWTGYAVEDGLAWLIRRIEKDAGQAWAGVTVTTDSEGWIREVLDA